jgi:hypothetical protein
MQVTLPEVRSMTGFDLSRHLGWSWAALAAWVVLIPTVLSRRSIAQLRSARVAAAFLAFIPAVTCGILLAFPPRGAIVHIRFTYDWPLFVTLGLSMVATLVAVKLGGRVDDIRVARGTSAGQALH